MLSEPLRNAIDSRFGKVQAPPEPLHGGDINEVWLVHTSFGKIVLKTHSDPYPGMFPAEAKGLNLLSRSDTFRNPEVYLDSEAYLIMEYISPGAPQQVKGNQLGNALAGLHRNTAALYGLDHDNYIGSLPQSNRQHKNAAEFYVQERLLPQFEMAINKGYTFRGLDNFLQKLEVLIPEEPASLINGDLWSGNYMVSEKAEPCLIDPAVSYASREMDLAMMALFGGFPKNHIPAYNEVYPLTPLWEQRIPLWQLYYILVHLNLFGSGYYSRVMQIIKTYI
ncbi:fructosamine kinase family protein [Robertkochia flava]|uniref:fructosamine kinase family protein n=1 Tax=Robertkochia flava TaxID=3447986 RepID=UPI001CC920F4|nr:fructosamine kinase family protein [Robertkochia marina]